MWTPSYDYLEHHGIEGQKWGRRNGPPYPLDYDDHSISEKKKNPKSKLDNYTKEAQKIESIKNKNYVSKRTKKLLDKAHKSGNSDKKLAAAQSLHDDLTSSITKNWVNRYNRAVDISEKDIDDLNKKYEKYDFNRLDDPKNKKAYKEYMGKFVDIWESTYKDVLYSEFGEDPFEGLIENGKEWIHDVPFYDNIREYYKEEVGEEYSK